MRPHLRRRHHGGGQGSGQGREGVDFLLSMAVELDGRPRIFAVAGNTDGTDGAEEVAGAIVSPDSLTRARALGLSAWTLLTDNDARFLPDAQ
jgi:glycerate 2-kinase